MGVLRAELCGGARNRDQIVGKSESGGGLRGAQVRGALPGRERRGRADGGARARAPALLGHPLRAGRAGGCDARAGARRLRGAAFESAPLQRPFACMRQEN